MKENKFQRNQKRFRIKNSTKTAVKIDVMNWKIEEEKGDVVVAVFLNFRKSFETINRLFMLKIFI